MFRLIIIFSILFWAGVEASSLENKLPRIKIYLNSLEPYAYLNKDGEVVGEIVDKVSEFLNKSGLDYQFEIMPWKRGFVSVTTQPRDKNSLIGFFDRTKEREDNFHWILPLIVKKNHLISRNDPKLMSLTQEEIISGNYKAVCLEASSQCVFLAEFGFKPENIWGISDSTKEAVVNLVIRGRGDFFIGDFDLVKTRVEAAGIDPTLMHPLFEVVKSVDYLAAGKGLDPRLLKMLKSVK